MSNSYDLVHLTTRGELHEWLAAHHDASPGIWLVVWRRPELGPRIEYDDVVEECLCIGWIDSTVRTIDDDRTGQRLTPRKAGSAWSRTNKVRIEKLAGDGLIEPSGQRLIDQAKADGSWELLDDVEDLIVPDDLAAALAARGATEEFAALTPSRQKGLLWWIKSAKRDQTRRDRIARTASAAAEGRSALG